MPRFERPFRSIEELHETQLDIFAKMIRTGVAVAIPAAEYYCSEHGLAAPAWLTKASVNLHCNTLRGDTTKKRGRASGPVTRYRQDMIDFARWDEICVVREQQKIFRRQVAKLRALAKVPRHMLNEKEKMLNRLGHTFDDAYEYVSKDLKKTNARGGWDTMRRSYREVERISKDPTQAMRYHQLDSQFLRRLGIKAPLDVRHGVRN